MMSTKIVRENLIVRVNKAFTQITGYTEAEALGRNPNLLSSGRQDANFYRAMWDTLHATGLWQGELWNRRKDGEVYPQLLTISTVRNEARTPASAGVPRKITVGSLIEGRSNSVSAGWLMVGG